MLEHSTSAASLRAVATWATTDPEAERLIVDALPNATQPRLGLGYQGWRIFRAFCVARPEHHERWLGRLKYADREPLLPHDDEDDEGPS